ncbi:DHH family phosphoesterase [Haladaptatus sp. DYF46]|uniref:DHH family phosphoesterase n=1 Tax=Haladaptatus sp. DYF46 TaxID=2886041 RepID=UPI001E516EDB|nr:DHH family phosphoesterase [Haladaptatus sp. DYF46]
MSTSGRTASEDARSASDIAATLRDADFVRLVARADGDALASSGLLARACATVGIPFQVSVTTLPARRVDSRDDELVVTVGASGGGVSLPDRPTSIVAFDVATELGGKSDPVLALAGAVAAGCSPGADGTARLLEAADDRLTRRPGVSTPTEDLADGLAHSTLFHAGFSGTVESVQAELAELGLPVELDDDAHRRVASLVALSVAGPGNATPRAAETVERALRPYELSDGPFATVGGYADVLDAVSREQPGTGIALALGHDARAPALDAWRTHAETAHATLREATTGRYDGLFVARTDDVPVATAARLLGDFRSPEPVTLVVTDDEAAAVAIGDRGTGDSDVDAPDIGDAMERAGSRLGGDGTGTERRGYARFDADAKEFLSAFREAL